VAATVLDPAELVPAAHWQPIATVAPVLSAGHATGRHVLM
jgi:hypothetical protein